MNGTPMDRVSISYPPTNPRLGSLTLSSVTMPAMVVPRYMFTGLSKVA